MLTNYKNQTNFTDPKQLVFLYSNLPNSINSIVKLVNALLIHPSKLSKYPALQVSEQEVNNEPRTVFEILQKLHNKSKKCLTEPRSPQERVIVTCRGFTLLLTSILRHQGVPARARAGFAPYIVQGVNIDHFICEYYDELKQDWILLDADFMKIDFNRNEFFNVANVYEDCLANKQDAMKFGCNSEWGYSYIIMYLNLDLLCLVKEETWYNPKTPLTNKLVWGGKKDYSVATQNLTDSEKELLHKLAELMKDCHKNYNLLKEFLNNNQFLQPVSQA